MSEEQTPKEAEIVSIEILRQRREFERDPSFAQPKRPGLEPLDDDDPTFAQPLRPWQVKPKPPAEAS